MWMAGAGVGASCTFIWTSCCCCRLLLASRFMAVIAADLLNISIWGCSASVTSAFCRCVWLGEQKRRRQDSELTHKIVSEIGRQRQGGSEREKRGRGKANVATNVHHYINMWPQSHLGCWGPSKFGGQRMFQRSVTSWSLRCCLGLPPCL